MCINKINKRRTIMALEIFSYRFKTPNIDTNKTYTIKELDQLGLSAITVKDQEDFKTFPEDIINDFAEIVDVQDDLYEIHGPNYVYHKEEVAYQTEPLNNFGREIAPANTQYSNDKDLVYDLVQEGGLDQSFIDNWVDDETAIMLWY